MTDRARVLVLRSADDFESKYIARKTELYALHQQRQQEFTLQAHEQYQRDLINAGSDIQRANELYRNHQNLLREIAEASKEELRGAIEQEKSMLMWTTADQSDEAKDLPTVTVNEQQSRDDTSKAEHAEDVNNLESLYKQRKAELIALHKQQIRKLTNMVHEQYQKEVMSDADSKQSADRIYRKYQDTLQEVIRAAEAELRGAIEQEKATLMWSTIFPMDETNDVLSLMMEEQQRQWGNREEAKDSDRDMDEEREIEAKHREIEQKEKELNQVTETLRIREEDLANLESVERIAVEKESAKREAELRQQELDKRREEIQLRKQQERAHSEKAKQEKVRKQDEARKAGLQKPVSAWSDSTRRAVQPPSIDLSSKISTPTSDSALKSSQSGRKTPYTPGTSSSAETGSFMFSTEDDRRKWQAEQARRQREQFERESQRVEKEKQSQAAQSFSGQQDIANKVRHPEPSQLNSRGTWNSWDPRFSSEQQKKGEFKGVQPPSVSRTQPLEASRSSPVAHEIWLPSSLPKGSNVESPRTPGFTHKQTYPQMRRSASAQADHSPDSPCFRGNMSTSKSTSGYQLPLTGAHVNEPSSSTHLPSSRYITEPVNIPGVREIPLPRKEPEVPIHHEMSHQHQSQAENNMSSKVHSSISQSSPSQWAPQLSRARTPMDNTAEDSSQTVQSNSDITNKGFGSSIYTRHDVTTELTDEKQTEEEEMDRKQEALQTRNRGFSAYIDAVGKIGSRKPEPPLLFKDREGAVPDQEIGAQEMRRREGGLRQEELDKKIEGVHSRFARFERTMQKEAQRLKEDRKAERLWQANYWEANHQSANPPRTSMASFATYATTSTASSMETFSSTGQRFWSLEESESHRTRNADATAYATLRASFTNYNTSPFDNMPMM